LLCFALLCFALLRCVAGRCEVVCKYCLILV
jgi:hypothetical protein